MRQRNTFEEDIIILEISEDLIFILIPIDVMLVFSFDLHKS